MHAVYLAIALGSSTVAFVCWMMVMAYAMQDDWAMAILAFLLPPFLLWYVVSGYQHRYRRLVAIGMVGGLVVAILAYRCAQTAMSASS